MKKFLYPLIDSRFEKEEINAAIKVIKSKQLTISEITEKFEKRFAKFVGSKYAVMVNSGSSANLLAVSALCNPARLKNLKNGDEVIIPGICWSTSLWPLVQHGLRPVFVDVDLDTLNISIQDLKKKISSKTKLIFCVHVLGNSSNMREIKEIAKKKKIFIIEDACVALGSKYNNKNLGTFGNFGTFSFFYSKQITSGEGGMIVCDSKSDYQLLLSLRSHGWSRNEKSHHKKMIKLFPKLEPRFIFSNYGYNLRPLEIQAAIANEQLNKIKRFEKNRAFNRIQIIKHFFLKNKVNINKCIFINSAKNVKASWCGISILLNKNLKKFKNKIIKKIEKSGLETRPIVCGNILNQPAIKLFELNKKKTYLKNCQEIEERGFYIGLNTKKSSLEKLKKISKILNNSINKF